MQSNRLPSTGNNAGATTNAADGNQEVKIRIWDGTTGHISLETKDVYISFWPSKAIRIHNLEEAVAGKFHTLDEDRQIERKPAEHIYLMSLPFVEIAQLLIPMKIMMQEINALKWRISGNSENRIDGRQYNCAAFSYRFLMNSGIESKISRQQFGRFHQLFLLITAIIAIVGGVLKSKSVNEPAAIALICIGVIGFTLKYSQACYVRFSTYHPLTFEQIPITPGRIKGLIECAGARMVDSDATIARFPTFQLNPNTVGDAGSPLSIEVIMQTIIRLQYISSAFFHNIQHKDNRIPGLLDKLNRAHQNFHGQNTLNTHIEVAISLINDIGCLYILLSKFFNPALAIAHLSSHESHRFPRSEAELGQLNQLVETSHDIQISQLFQNILIENLFLPLYTRFPFVQSIIEKLQNNQIVFSDITVNLQEYLLNGIKITSIVLSAVVLQRDIIYLQAKLKERNDDLLNQNFHINSQGMFARVVSEQGAVAIQGQASFNRRDQSNRI